MLKNLAGGKRKSSDERKCKFHDSLVRFVAVPDKHRERFVSTVWEGTLYTNASSNFVDYFYGYGLIYYGN